MIANRTILQGQVLDKLKEIDTESIDCIVTSPPYWNLRDYKIEGQWGLEPDFKQYLEKMKDLMAELKRVLKKTGSCWINLGDTYNGSGSHGEDEFFGKQHLKKGVSANYNRVTSRLIQTKSLHLIPFEFAINCRDAGWTVRNNIIWYKSNSMPSPIKDRFTNKYEFVFFMVKNRRYYFNLDAIRIKPKTASEPFNLRVREAKAGRGIRKLGEFGFKMSEEEDQMYDKNGVRKEIDVPGQSPHGIHRRLQEGLSDWVGYGDVQGKPDNKQDKTLGADGQPKKTYAGFNKRYNERKHQEQTISRIHSHNHNMETGEPLNHPLGKNPGDVFFENSKARIHFDENGNCFGCGEHWTKHTVSERAKGSMSDALSRTESICWCNPKGKNPGDIFFINPHPFPEAHFATFPIELPLTILSAACPPSGYVLDPFFGAGTVGVAAEQLALNWIGIELKQEYIDISKKRLEPYMTERLM